SCDALQRSMTESSDFERPRTWSELVRFLKKAAEAFIGRSHQWVAGEMMDDALRVAKESNGRGMEAIINHLGERFFDRDRVEATTREYRRLLDAMQAHGIRGAISVKPTQFGLLIDKGYTLPNCSRSSRRRRPRTASSGWTWSGWGRRTTR